MTDLPHFAASKTSALLLDLGYYDHSCVNLCVDVSLLMSKFLARELLSDMVANCIWFFFFSFSDYNNPAISIMMKQDWLILLFDLRQD